jgi:glycosyltransferase involved in cell wall biosynthesis
MESPKVSVIVPVYNSEEFIHRCIDSILAQTFTNFECILIDDGSTDNSLDICNQYHKTDNRFIVIHQQNSGVSAARNKGLEISRGQYICFIDSDDFAQNNMLEKLFTAISNSNTDVVVSGYTENNKACTICNEDFILSDLSTIEIVHYLEMRQAFGLVWNKLFNKTILDTHTIRFPMSIKFGEDMIFNLEYFRHVKTAYISHNNLYNYLHDNQSAVTKDKLTFTECYFRFENVSNRFIQIDNNTKSLFCSELLAKDFQYTIALLLRLYSEEKRINERLNVIKKLKRFYRDNNAKNKFRTKVVTVTYKMLLHTPAKLFGIIFSLIFITYTGLVKAGKSPSRFVRK